jgi:hypothetical protein
MWCESVPVACTIACLSESHEARSLSTSTPSQSNTRCVKCAARQRGPDTVCLGLGCGCAIEGPTLSSLEWCKQNAGVTQAPDGACIPAQFQWPTLA